MSDKMNIEQKLDKQISMIVQGSMTIKTNVRITYNAFLKDKMLIISVIRSGVPYALFNLIQYTTPFSENDWADLLDISKKSLHRYRDADKHFKPLQSEKIIEIAEVTQIGIDVFGDVSRFKLWLDTPNFSLGSLKPLELLKDSYGKEMVVGELIRINHGIFA